MGLKDILIKAGFVEETQDEQPTVSTNVPVTQTTVCTPSSAPPQDISKFAAHFEELFEKANLPGPDYFEFSKMTQAMTMLTDDVRIPTAFSGLQVQGLTKEKLLSSAQQYITIIDNDSKNFSDALDSKVVAEINRKKADLESKRQSIAQKADMIKKLQDEIAADATVITTTENEILVEERKVGDKTAAYKAASESKKSLIMADIQKINSYLK